MRALWLVGAFCLFTISLFGQAPCPNGKPGCKKTPPLTSFPGTCDVDAIPAGSYKQTCRMQLDCTTKTTITGSCKKFDGTLKPASLTVTGCTDIENCDGTLRCNVGGSPPQGSYRQSCRCVHVRNGRLTADCRRSNGSWTGTDGSVLPSFASCKNVDNIEGKLSCTN